MESLVFMLPITFAGAWGLAYGMAVLAHRKAWLDQPNHRSSHTIPTPRGGGVSLIFPVLIVLGAAVQRGIGSRIANIILMMAVLAVALVGWLDDRHGLRASIRLLVHFFSAGAFLVSLFMFDLPLDVSPWISMVYCILGAFFLVWMLNLYNFMDGLDGIAGLQTLVVTLWSAVFCALQGNSAVAACYAMLAAASAGFLMMNWAPARIFMGDVGSGFIGFVLGGLILLASWGDWERFWPLLIPHGVFIIDATVSLLTRILRGQNPTQAHRTHVCQKLSIHFASHEKVTLIYGAISFFWLGFMAVLAYLNPKNGLLVLTLAWLPLVILAVWAGAGRETPLFRPSSSTLPK